MVSKINDGGPAFPQADLSGYGMGPSENPGGMTLRDWFAGQALAGLNAALANTQSWPTKKSEMYENAYMQADAMLAAREAKP